MVNPRCSPRLVLAAGFICLSVVAGTRAAGQQQTSLPSNPQRLAEMRHHFLQVTLVYEAVIRGDLAAVRAPATELSILPTPTGLPLTAAPFVDAIRTAGRQAAVATTLEAAAAPAAMMLAQCGECHRAAGIFPAPSARTYPDVGGLVGHMLEHQRAADELLQGLLIPSESRWTQGAARLRAAELSRADLPSDPKLTPEVRKAEAAVHALADRAAAASTTAARAAVYVDLATTCARCHTLHRQIWGPKTGA
jgi:mono/diheme cytochrome c family protein